MAKKTNRAATADSHPTQHDAAASARAAADGIRPEVDMVLTSEIDGELPEISVDVVCWGPDASTVDDEKHIWDGHVRIGFVDDAALDHYVAEAIALHEAAKPPTQHGVDIGGELRRVELKRREEGYPGNVQVLTMRCAADDPDRVDAIQREIDEMQARIRQAAGVTTDATKLATARIRELTSDLDRMQSISTHLPQALDIVREWIDATGWQWRTDRLPIHLRVEWTGTEPKLGEQRGVETYLTAKGYPIHGTSFRRAG